ncbi:hypothetical protein [Aliiglaciecola sp. LCG003]|uniref:hypothetical protein n=1 Tax=Aliiglaciecola sp. LCG003 TaxID=3053655 RepID=UPI002573A697|nr:hypothetical protein [Aliiglaciecola sp. LCG003]WJG07989.1 hypothetical protein QR722_11515 [Aliiglaciecola sp. LCG003]
MKAIILNILVAILIGALAVTLSASASNKKLPGKLFTGKGYPYNLLLSRGGSVKIIYTEEQQGINCRVIANIQGQSVSSDQNVVQKSDFERSPLASCLPREVAKHWLAKTFD